MSFIRQTQLNTSISNRFRHLFSSDVIYSEAESFFPAYKMYVLLQNVQIYVHMYSMHYVKSNTSPTLFVGVRRCFHLNHVFTVCDYLLLKHIKNDAKNTHVFHSIRLDHVRSNRHCKHLCKFYRYVRKKNKLIFHRNRSKYANLVFMRLNSDMFNPRLSNSIEKLFAIFCAAHKELRDQKMGT